jgi:hypothetical protein
MASSPAFRSAATAESRQLAGMQQQFGIGGAYIKVIKGVVLRELRVPLPVENLKAHRRVVAITL